MKTTKYLILSALLMLVGNDALAQSLRLDNANLKNQYLMLDKEMVDIDYNGFATVAVAANCD